MAKVLKIMDHTGHSTIEITEKTKAEAKATFDRILADGGVAYRMDGPPGTPATKIKSYDEIGEETILRSQLVGG